MGSQLGVYKPLWLKTEKSLARNQSESLGLGRSVHRGQQGVCRPDAIGDVHRGGQGGSKAESTPAGRSLCSSCRQQTPEVSVTICGQVNGTPPVPFSPCPIGPGSRLGGLLCSESDHPNGTPKGRQTPLSILPPQNPRKTLLWDLLSGPPQGAERMRNGFPQTRPRMQGIRASHPTNSRGVCCPSRGSYSRHRSRDPSCAGVLPTHFLPASPSLACPDLPKQRCFSPCCSGSPHFRQTCACFLSAWAHLGLPPQAPPSPGDKPRIVFRDLINDNTPPPPATYPTSPPSSPFPAEVSLVLSVALPQSKNRRLMSRGERNLPAKGTSPSACECVKVRSRERPCRWATPKPSLLPPAQAWNQREHTGVVINNDDDKRRMFSPLSRTHLSLTRGLPSPAAKVNDRRD